MATQRRGRDPQATAFIHAKAFEGWNGPEIYIALERMRVRGEIGSDAVPSARTIQRDVKALRPPHSGTGWRFSPGEGIEGGFVLSVLAEVALVTGGRVTEISIETAAWLEAIYAATRDIPPWPAYVLASMYGARVARDLTTKDLDIWLAFAPWRGVEAARRYEQLVAGGKIPPSPMAVNHASRVVLAAAAIGTDAELLPNGDAELMYLERSPIDPETFDALVELDRRVRIRPRKTHRQKGTGAEGDPHD